MYTTQTDVNGSIPAWVINMGVSKIAPNYISKLREASKIYPNYLKELKKKEEEILK